MKLTSLLQLVDKLEQDNKTDNLQQVCAVSGRVTGKYKQEHRIYLLSFVETPRKFIIAELSIRKLGSSSVLIIISIIRYY